MRPRSGKGPSLAGAVARRGLMAWWWRVPAAAIVMLALAMLAVPAAAQGSTVSISIDARNQTGKLREH